MKLLSVVLGDNGKFNNDIVIKKDKYDNDVVENTSTSQRIRIGKYLVPTLEKIFESEIDTVLGKDLLSIYNFSDDGHHVVNKKNYSIIMIKNSNKDGDKFKDQHLLYVTIPTSNTKIVDSMVNLNYAEIINTYRSNNMIGAIIKIDTSRFPSTPITENEDSKYKAYRDVEVKVGEFILYNQDAEKEEERLVRKVITVTRDLSSIYVTTSFTEDEYFKDELENMLESNFFKKIIISPTKEIRTSTYIVNEDRLPEFTKIVGDDDKLEELGINSVLGMNPTIFKKGTEEEKNYFDQCMKDHILNNKVRAITTVGVKLPKEFYTKYKINVCFTHDLSTGLIRCMKSN